MLDRLGELIELHLDSRAPGIADGRGDRHGDQRRQNGDDHDDYQKLHQSKRMAIWPIEFHGDIL